MDRSLFADFMGHGTLGEAMDMADAVRASRDPLEGHGEDCILRCGQDPDTCRADHACDKCAADAE